MNDGKHFYDSAPCYYFSFSSENLIVHANQYLLDELGYSKAEVEAKMRFEDFLTVGGKIFFQTHLYPLVKLQKKANEIYLSLMAKDKREIPVLLNMILEGDDSG